MTLVSTRPSFSVVVVLVVPGILIGNHNQAGRMASEILPKDGSVRWMDGWMDGWMKIPTG